MFPEYAYEQVYGTVLVDKELTPPYRKHGQKKVKKKKINTSIMNIAEILKDKPKGTKLYSIPWGKCTLEEVATSLPLLPITVRNCLDDLQKRYTKKGTYLPSLDECLLFPSKDMRNWYKFAWKKGDIVINIGGGFGVSFGGWKNDDYTEFICEDPFIAYPDGKIIEIDRGKRIYKTSDFRSSVLYYDMNIVNNINSTTGESSVKTVKIKVGNSEPNEPNKPIEPKYSFKPFDKVLVRDSDDEKWSCDFFSYMKDGQAICTGTYGFQCLPYNEDTAKLVGTTKSLEDIR